MEDSNHNHRASIAIFKNSVPYEENQGQPLVPSIIFDTVKKVLDTKGCEFVKTRDGVYIVKYSPTGPFPDPIGNDWLPVYVARLEKWSSGGVKKSEMNNYEGIVETFSSEQQVINGDPVN